MNVKIDDLMRLVGELYVENRLLNARVAFLTEVLEEAKAWQSKSNSTEETKAIDSIEESQCPSGLLS